MSKFTPNYVAFPPECAHVCLCLLLRAHCQQKLALKLINHYARRGSACLCAILCVCVYMCASERV